MVLSSPGIIGQFTRCHCKIAQGGLRKQVHSNFVKLALAQAEMGNPIPPLCSVFVRLFLLQGVAYKMMRNYAEATTRLDCQRLRTSSPSDIVMSCAMCTV